MMLLYYMLKYIKQFIGWISQLRRITKALQRFPGPPRNWPFGNMHLVGGDYKYHTQSKIKIISLSIACNSLNYC